MRGPSQNVWNSQGKEKNRPPTHNGLSNGTRGRRAGAWVWCRLHTQSAPTNDKMTDISDGGTENKSPDVIDVSDSRDFMAQALAKVKEAQASGGKVTVDVPLMSSVSPLSRLRRSGQPKQRAIKDASQLKRVCALHLPHRRRAPP